MEEPSDPQEAVEAGGRSDQGDGEEAGEQVSSQIVLLVTELSSSYCLEVREE